MTTRMRSLAAAVLTLSAAFGLTTVSGGPAAAADSQCPVGEFCLWEHSGFQGRFAYSSEPQPNVGDYMNDRLTSFWNRTDNWISLYDDDKFEGCLISIRPGAKIPAISSWANDLTTSFRPGNFCRWTS
ncbi:peptidase inhibitor family I36 protein [Streptomyces sp. CA-288835]|uniref:peptidase inhibitor family I36 protein n=1 Tax=Streptomyces sp. CA-288835 TaxID=3240069 RepID=UPI003D8C9D34